MVLAGLAFLLTGGCGPDGGDGMIVTTVALPTDTLLNLNCANVGVHLETCILDDPENPYITATIREFDENDPEAITKFELAQEIPVGPSGAKARFYLWGTALARRASGENQWYTARALHELFDASGDPIVQEQALKAYRSVLENFFGSVTFFVCCGDVAFSASLNELVGDDLYRTAATGFERLVPGDPLLTQALLAEWGFTYQPATPPNFDNGVMSVNDG